MGIFFAERPVDFNAVDGEPVFVLFPILCSTVKGHLLMLSQISHLLNSPDMREYLRSHPNRTELLSRIEDALPQTG